MATILACIVLVVFAHWTAVWFLQRSVLFPAPPVEGAPARPADAQQVWLETHGARVEAWFLPPRSSPGPAPLLLYTHGNGELIDFWPLAFAEPRSWGLGVLLVEYPGYGRSTGVPSEKSIARAMDAAYDWALATPGIDRARIMAYGRSLGGGAAGALAKRRPTAALVLESTFTSVRAFARGFHAPGFLVRDLFDNLEVVRAYRGPLLILHGEHDELIPVVHARALAAASPQAELHLLDCGHNDCERPWLQLRAFLKRNALL